MPETITIEVHKESFLRLINILCDAMLEDEHPILKANRDKLLVKDRTLSTPGLAQDVDLRFLIDLLPKIENNYPGILGYYSPILCFIEKAFPEEE